MGTDLLCGICSEHSARWSWVVFEDLDVPVTQMVKAKELIFIAFLILHPLTATFVANLHSEHVAESGVVKPVTNCILEFVSLAGWHFCLTFSGHPYPDKLVGAAFDFSNHLGKFTRLSNSYVS